MERRLLYKRLARNRLNQQAAKTNPRVMLNIKVLFAMSVHLIPTIIRAQSCPADHSVELCCRSVMPYSSYPYLFDTLCHIPIDDESTEMGAGCTSPAVCA